MRQNCVHEIKAISNFKVLILDDLVSELKKSIDLESLYTKHSHHWSMSVIFVSQVLFPKSDILRNVSSNSLYYVLFKNIRDVASFSYLARQIEPGNCKELCKIHKRATKEPFHYLFITLHPKAKEITKYRSDILGENEHSPQVLYNPMP